MTPQEKQTSDAQNFNRLVFIGEIVQDIRVKPAKLSPAAETSMKEFYPMVDVDMPDKGVKVYWKGLERPTKTFPFKETVEHVDDLKKVMMASIRSFSSMFKNNPIKTLLFLIFFRKELENTALDMLAEFHVRLREIKNKDEKYCKTVREIHRTLSTMGEPSKEGEKSKHHEKIRDIVCMILEYDDAYRYRLQDIIRELKKGNLGNTPKELNRLLDILSDKEGGEEVMAGKWSKIKKMLIILRFKKDLREKVREFLLRLNLEELEMDSGDIYHSKKKHNFWWHYLPERPKPK